MYVGSDQSSHERSVSLVCPGKSPAIPRRRFSRTNSTRPSREMSLNTRLPAPAHTRRCCPDRVVANRLLERWIFDAVYQISFPEGAQASPRALEKSPLSVVFLPARSTMAMLPKLS